SMRNAFVSMLVGLLIASIGVDETYGTDRFSFGLNALRDGIDYLAVMVGAYGLGEVLARLEKGFASSALQKVGSITTKLPTIREIMALKGTLVRSTIVGIIAGIKPGAGATIASFLSYGFQ